MSTHDTKHREAFTADMAMRYQEEHMAQWKGILTAEAYSRLEDMRDIHNRIWDAKGKPPYGCWRGVSIDSAVMAIARQTQERAQLSPLTPVREDGLVC